jgi:hypothetical protein
MKSITFPVWLFVNDHVRRKEGYPYHPMLRGGAPTSLPTTLPVFSTEQIAKKVVGTSPPFKPIEVDRDSFRDLIGSYPGIEDVLLDMGTDGASSFRVTDLLAEP